MAGRRWGRRGRSCGSSRGRGGGLDAGVALPAEEVEELLGGASVGVVGSGGGGGVFRVETPSPPEDVEEVRREKEEEEGDDGGDYDEG